MHDKSIISKMLSHPIATIAIISCATTGISKIVLAAKGVDPASGVTINVTEKAPNT